MLLCCLLRYLVIPSFGISISVVNRKKRLRVREKVIVLLHYKIVRLHKIMGRYARKKQHKGDKPMKAKYRLKRRTKDLDEIHEDMKPEQSSKLLQQEVDYDVPGCAQHYCLHCTWVISLRVLNVYPVEFKHITN